MTTLTTGFDLTLVNYKGGMDDAWRKAGFEDLDHVEIRTAESEQVSPGRLEVGAEDQITFG